MTGLDLARFAALLQRLGAPRSADIHSIFERLLRAWSEPARAYHNPAHLARCLELLDGARAEADRPDDVGAALWFHDAVYDPRRTDNEARSEELASAELTAAGIATSALQRIGRLILTTRHDRPPQDRDERLIADIDLAILGAPAEEFDAYDRAIRAEYAWVPDERFRRERCAVLRDLLQRSRLYHTARFRDLERPARDNLTRALRCLG